MPVTMSPPKTTSCGCLSTSMRIGEAGAHTKYPALPDQLAGLLVEGRHRLIGPAHRHDDRVVVEDGTAAVPACGERRVEFLDQVVRPDAFARGLVDREQLAPRAHREQASPGDERRAVRAEPLIELDAGGWRGILELPERLAAGGVEGGDDFFVRDAGWPRPAGTSYRDDRSRPGWRSDPRRDSGSRVSSGRSRASSMRAPSSRT